MREIHVSAEVEEDDRLYQDYEWACPHCKGELFAPWARCENCERP